MYIDVFRGVMALVMVQGHLFETLLSPDVRRHPLYLLQGVFHGSTAPGFLFASGFVVGLPRAPLSLRASVRRARRILFVLGVGYALHLPYLSFWKTVTSATPSQRAALFACDALQVIAVTQLFVLVLQRIAGRRWATVTAVIALIVLAAGPSVWAGGIAASVHPAIAAYLDGASGSPFPLFPFSAFVLAGTVAGAAIGRQDEATRHRRAVLFGLALLLGGLGLAIPLHGRVGFWGISPAYVFIRLGGLLLLLRLVEHITLRNWPRLRPLAIIGHETLLVYVLHLYLLYGGVVGPSPLADRVGTLGLPGACVALAAMIALLFGVAWVWHRIKMRAPHGANRALVFLTTVFVWEFLTRPW